MIDSGAVKQNLEEWFENPYWAEFYNNAPSDNLKEYIALLFYASETEEDEVWKAMDEMEPHFSLEDWKYLYANITGPERAKYAKMISQLEG